MEDVSKNETLSPQKSPVSGFSLSERRVDAKIILGVDAIYSR